MQVNASTAGIKPARKLTAYRCEAIRMPMANSRIVIVLCLPAHSRHRAHAVRFLAEVRLDYIPDCCAMLLGEHLLHTIATVLPFR